MSDEMQLLIALCDALGFQVVEKPVYMVEIDEKTGEAHNQEFLCTEYKLKPKGEI